MKDYTRARLATASLAGSIAQVATVKATFNYFVGFALKGIALTLGFGGWLINAPFNVLTFLLALAALSLGGLMS